MFFDSDYSFALLLSLQFSEILLMPASMVIKNQILPLLSVPWRILPKDKQPY
jgi:hypothetical protein